MRNPYNPFNKPFEDVDKNDLEILKAISEGWFIEYKSEKLSGQKIARSISSFANSHGGLYFIGIEEDSKTNCAKEIVGVTDSPDVIGDSLKGNLSPVPFFETFSIQLDNGNHVIMVFVPEGKNTPYINSDGRIYRRQGASSEPIFETNRFIVDELYQRSTNYEKEIEKFRKGDWGITNAESNETILEIYVNTRPFNKWFIKNFGKKDFLRLFAESKTVKDSSASFNIHIPFDSLATFHQGVSLRKIRGEDLAYNGLTMEIDVFGNAKFLIPLRTLTPDEVNEYLKKEMSFSLKQYSTGIETIDIIDGGNTFALVVGLLNLHEEFLSKENYQGDLETKFRLYNCHRTLLFFRSNDFVSYMEKNGLPICMKQDQYFPRVPIITKNEELNSENRLFHLLSQSARVLEALGVPHEISMKASFDHINKINSLPSYNPS